MEEQWIKSSYRAVQKSWQSGILCQLFCDFCLYRFISGEDIVIDDRPGGISERNVLTKLDGSCDRFVSHGHDIQVEVRQCHIHIGNHPDQRDEAGKDAQQE